MNSKKSLLNTLRRQTQIYLLEQTITEDKNLIGSAAVHYVVAEISKMGLLALITEGTTPAIDLVIIDTKTHNYLFVQVKGKAHYKEKLYWRFSTKPKEISTDDLAFVFVDLKGTFPTFYTVPSKEVYDYVELTHKLYLEKTHAENTNQRQLPNDYGDFNLESFKGFDHLIEQLNIHKHYSNLSM